MDTLPDESSVIKINSTVNIYIIYGLLAVLFISNAITLTLIICFTRRKKDNSYERMGPSLTPTSSNDAINYMRRANGVSTTNTTNTTNTINTPAVDYNNSLSSRNFSDRDHFSTQAQYSFNPYRASENFPSGASDSSYSRLDTSSNEDTDGARNYESIAHSIPNTDRFSGRLQNVFTPYRAPASFPGGTSDSSGSESRLDTIIEVSSTEDSEGARNYESIGPSLPNTDRFSSRTQNAFNPYRASTRDT